ncbi:RrF2 family transcriptional regulator [Filifactor villosus]|uniref:RrF2 family transcriptional regulator n=1 Tax=Filifactor villosus TaxID=29374 RepID=A0ABV9QPJ4_9FIRM
MKLSTKGRYGLKAMFDIATIYERQEPISLKQIAEKNHLSEQYLEQIFSVLKKSGLVKSIRGAQGGYMLGRQPSEITVGDIIRVLEGPIAPSMCVLEEETDCIELRTCPTRDVWKQIKDSVDEVIDNITLEDMLLKNQKKTQVSLIDSID